jgi:hypothetical protein
MLWHDDRLIYDSWYRTLKVVCDRRLSRLSPIPWRTLAHLRRHGAARASPRLHVVVLDAHADDPRLGDGDDVRVGDGLSLRLWQRRDDGRGASNQVKRCVGCELLELLVEEHGLDGVDDTDTDGGTGELGKRDHTGRLGDEVGSVVILCLDRNERVLEREADTEPRIWYPMSFALAVFWSMVKRRPKPTAEIGGPTTNSGQYLPTPVTKPPEMKMAIQTESMNGRMSTPELTGVRPRPAW